LAGIQNAVGTSNHILQQHANTGGLDLIIDDPIVSNRHCLIFTENKGGDTVAVVEDLSSNGTFINEAVIGRNKRRELQDQDEITVLDKARFVFRYPKNRETSAFVQQYTLLEKLGKGHFAEVFLCVEKASGQRYAVKIFTKQPGVEERSKTEGLQQEIAVLMGVSHPNMLCLKDTFDEPNAVYLVLELAAEGELFNWIVMKQKLTEEETRKVFIQLFQGVKYLVSLVNLFHLSRLTYDSMSEGLFTEISSRRTFCLRTKISTSSWLILDWPRLSARSLSRLHYVEPLVTLHLKFSKIADIADILVQ
jgi:pSer/pThr/pTyr-binding forkhead associated (FHA) protein